VRAFYVDVADLDPVAPPSPQTLRGRLGRTFAAAGLGLPYMLGLRTRRHTPA
jgi:hypothetical protein